MEHVMLTKLREAGCDMEGTLERFMNNEVFKKVPPGCNLWRNEKSLCTGQYRRVF